MKKIALIICILILAAVDARAQATRTWVSGVGDDANPCSRTAPGKTFAGAQSKTAAQGEIDCLDPGEFGVVAITKSLTIDSGGVFGAVAAVSAGGSGIVINAGATDVVTLRGLSLQGLGIGGTGIRIIGGGTVLIDGCYISGWDKGIDISQTSACKVTVTGCRISGGTAGVRASLSAAGSRLAMDRVQISDAGIGVDLVLGTADVSNSVISQNDVSGLLAEGGTLNSFNNVLAANGKDIAFTGTGMVRSFNNSGPLSLSLGQDTTVTNVTPGQPAVFNLTLTPPPGGFTAPVNFSSVGLPGGFTCTFTPSSIPAGAGATAVKMTVTPPQAKLAASLTSGEAGRGSFPLLPGAIVLALGVLAVPSLRLRLGALVIPALISVVLITTAGCGGSGSGAVSTAQVDAAPAATASPSATATATPTATPTTTPTPSPTPLQGAFPFTVTATSGSSSVSKTYLVNFAGTGAALR